MRKNVKVILFFGMPVFILSLFVNTAEAAVANHVCDIVSINVINDGSCTIGVNENGHKRTVAIPEGLENKMMAVALTAFSLGQQIKARFDWNAQAPVFEWIRIFDDSL